MDPVIDRYRSVTEILSTVRRFARSTARAVTDRLADVLEDGRPLRGLGDFQELIAADLEKSWQRLVDADEAFQDAKAKRHDQVGQRDRQTTLLYREVVDLRMILRGRFGNDASMLFIGLRGATSRDPVVLLRQADRAVARLLKPSRTLIHSRPSPDPATRDRWAAPVAAAADALRPTVTGTADAAKAAETARFLRRRTLEEFNDNFLRGAGLVEALYRYSGHDELAEMVRPSKQRKGWLLRGDRNRGKRPKKTAKPPARLLSFRSLRRVWRQLPSHRESR